MATINSGDKVIITTPNVGTVGASISTIGNLKTLETNQIGFASMGQDYKKFAISQVGNDNTGTDRKNILIVSPVIGSGIWENIGDSCAVFKDNLPDNPETTNVVTVPGGILFYQTRKVNGTTFNELLVSQGNDTILKQDVGADGKVTKNTFYQRTGTQGNRSWIELGKFAPGDKTVNFAALDDKLQKFLISKGYNPDN